MSSQSAVLQVFVLPASSSSTTTATATFLVDAKDNVSSQRYSVEEYEIWNTPQKATWHLVSTPVNLEEYYNPNQIFHI